MEPPQDTGSLFWRSAKAATKRAIPKRDHYKTQIVGALVFSAASYWLSVVATVLALISSWPQPIQWVAEGIANAIVGMVCLWLAYFVWSLFDLGGGTEYLRRRLENLMAPVLFMCVAAVLYGLVIAVGIYWFGNSLQSRLDSIAQAASQAASPSQVEGAQAAQLVARLQYLQEKKKQLIEERDGRSKILNMISKKYVDGSTDIIDGDIGRTEEFLRQSVIKQYNDILNSNVDLNPPAGYVAPKSLRAPDADKISDEYRRKEYIRQYDSWQYLLIKISYLIAEINREEKSIESNLSIMGQKLGPPNLSGEYDTQSPQDTGSGTPR